METWRQCWSSLVGPRSWCVRCSERQPCLSPGLQGGTAGAMAGALRDQSLRAPSAPWARGPCRVQAGVAQGLFCGGQRTGSPKVRPSKGKDHRWRLSASGYALQASTPVSLASMHPVPLGDRHPGVEVQAPIQDQAPRVFRGIVPTVLKDVTEQQSLSVEIVALLEKGAVTLLPSEKMGQGFYSTFFLIPTIFGPLCLLGEHSLPLSGIPWLF